MREGRSFIVQWYDERARRIRPVARFREVERPEGCRFEFSYVAGVREATEHGFTPFAAFPEIDVCYRSPDIFPFFRNRIMPTTRPDYVEHAEMLGLDPRSADALDVLGRSGGVRVTDRVEIVPVPTRTATGRFETRFLVRGVRHRPHGEETAAKLVPEEPLFLMIDLQNEQRPGAIALRTRSEHILGYVPEYLALDAEQLLRSSAPGANGSPRPLVRVVVERVNLPPISVHHRVLCRFEADWPDGLVPFSQPIYRPIGPWEDAPDGRAQRGEASPTFAP